MMYFSLCDNQYIFIASTMTLSLIFNMFFILIYRLRVVKKIDRILIKNGINKNNFDILSGRHILYVWATFFPKIFCRSGRQERLFNPELFRHEMTFFDKAIMLSHWFFLFVFIITFCFLDFFTDQ